MLKNKNENGNENEKSIDPNALNLQESLQTLI
jgi:hypothetical protein